MEPIKYEINSQFSFYVESIEHTQIKGMMGEVVVIIPLAELYWDSRLVEFDNEKKSIYLYEDNIDLKEPKIIRVIKVGQKITGKVLRVVAEKSTIVASIKDESQDPWGLFKLGNKNLYRAKIETVFDHGYLGVKLECGLDSKCLTKVELNEYQKDDIILVKVEGVDELRQFVTCSIVTNH